MCIFRELRKGERVYCAATAVFVASPSAFVGGAGNPDSVAAKADGEIVIVFVTLCVLYTPVNRSASSNMLFLKEIMTNCADVHRSLM